MRRTTAAAAAPKKFSFKTLPRGEGSGSSWKAGRRRSQKKSKASFALMAAKYQKGDKEGQLSGAIYFNGVPCYGQNEAFKEEMHKHTLAERLRFNDEKKVYSCRVYAAKQARKLLAGMKTLDGCADTLPDDIDESIFENANPAEISHRDQPRGERRDQPGRRHGHHLPTFKDELKEMGFSFHSELNGKEGVQMWIAQGNDLNIDEIIALFEEYGFAVETFDGVEDDE